MSFDHGYTYSAHPTCRAVALRNLDIIESEGLVKRAEEMGRRLMAGLKELEAVGEVRGLGLMATVELAAGRKGRPSDVAEVEGRVGAYLKGHGVITRVKGGTIMLAPPLVITENQVDRLVETVEGAARSAVRDHPPL